MFNKILDRIKRKKSTAKDADRFDKEVEIPVGGITPGGIIYEKKVYPDGKELLYKEVNIESSQPSQTTTEEEEAAQTKTTNTASE